MNFKSFLIFCILAVLVINQQPQIIDFTYTQLLQQANYTGVFKDKINITPESKQLQQYLFPEVCHLHELLKEGTDSSGAVDNFINPDDYLQRLRDKILSLLKLAEQLKNSRSYLSEISKHIDFNEDPSSISKFKSQLQSLAKKESLLSVSKKRIEDLTDLLNKKIREYNNNPKNQQFKSASLNFQIQNCNSKISYLRQLKERSISKASSQPHINFNNFFRQLGYDLQAESNQIDFMDRYFQNISHVKYLKDMADSLRDNIEVDRLNIQYKRSCEKDKIDIKNKGSSHDQIKQTLQHLRQKKKQIGNNTNKYCQGVALKLQMQIKRLLKAINWTFSCADGLTELQRKRQAQIITLESIQAQIRNYSSQGFDQYQRNYQNTKKNIQYKFDKITTFSIDEYVHQPAELDKLIAQTERYKFDAQQKLKNLPKQISGDQTFEQIKILAEQIKNQKAKFCHQFDGYQDERRKIWINIYQFESQQRYVSEMRNQFILQGKKLEELQRYYKEQSQNIIRDIENNYLVQ